MILMKMISTWMMMTITRTDCTIVTTAKMRIMTMTLMAITLMGTLMEFWDSRQMRILIMKLTIMMMTIFTEEEDEEVLAMASLIGLILILIIGDQDTLSSNIEEGGEELIHLKNNSQVQREINPIEHATTLLMSQNQLWVLVLCQLTQYSLYHMLTLLHQRSQNMIDMDHLSVLDAEKRGAKSKNSLSNKEVRSQEVAESLNKEEGDEGEEMMMMKKRIAMMNMEVNSQKTLMTRCIIKESSISISIRS